MKNLTTIIILLNTLTAFCQIDTEKQTKWKIGLFFSPDFYFNSITIPRDIHTGYNISPSVLNFTTGVIGLLPIKSKFEIGTGIAYSSKDFSVSWYCHVCDFIPQVELMKQRYLEVPMLVRYNILVSKFKLHVESGITSSFLINSIEKKHENILNSNNFLLIGRFGLGVNFDLGQRINLSWTSLYSHSFISSDLKLSSLGFATGIFYKI